MSGPPPISAPDIARAVGDLRDSVAGWRAAGQSVGLVPTMGALHAGHMALVDASLAVCDRTVVSIFVNPTQFGPGEDLDTYPRPEQEDLAKLAAAGVALAFVPAGKEIYTPGAVTSVSVGRLSAGLCGAARPHFFSGVATVVTKLLIQCLPDRAYFGEKDYQQLQVVRQLARDLDIPVEIVGVPTVREADGLALSSRNAYLGTADRSVAPALHRVLRETATALAGGVPVAEAIADGWRSLTQAGFTSVDYLAVCDPESLAPLERMEGPARVLAAVWLGETRLIDNLPVEPA